MLGPQHAATNFQRLGVERPGLVEPAVGLESHRQEVCCREGVTVLRAEHPAREFKYLGIVVFRQIVPAPILVKCRQVMHRCQGVTMFGAEHATASLQRLGDQPLGLIDHAPNLTQSRQAVHGVQGLGMLRAVQSATEFEGPLEMRLALRVEAEHPVRVADRLADRGLDLGLARELAFDCRRGLLQQRLDRDLFIAGVLLGEGLGQQVVLKEVAHGLGDGRLGLGLLGGIRGLAFGFQRAVSLQANGRFSPNCGSLGPGRPDGLPGAQTRAQGEQGRKPGGRHQQCPILSRELTQPVRHRRRACLDGLIGKVSLHVPGECAGRFVSPVPGRFFRARRITIRVQLAADEPRQPARISLLRYAATGMARVSRDSLSRLLGAGGSSSLIRRKISAYAADRSFARSRGVVPVSSS